MSTSFIHFLFDIKILHSRIRDGGRCCSVRAAILIVCMVGLVYVYFSLLTYLCLIFHGVIQCGFLQFSNYFLSLIILLHIFVGVTFNIFFLTELVFFTFSLFSFYR